MNSREGESVYQFLKRTAFMMIYTALYVFSHSSLLNARDWRAWNIHPLKYPVSIGMEHFSDILKEKSDNTLKINFYHGGVLGNLPDAIQQVRLGALDLAVFNLGPLGEVVLLGNTLNMTIVKLHGYLA